MNFNLYSCSEAKDRSMMIGLLLLEIMFYVCALMPRTKVREKENRDWK